jgi:hypothetical protein
MGPVAVVDVSSNAEILEQETASPMATTEG